MVFGPEAEPGQGAEKREAKRCTVDQAKVASHAIHFGIAEMEEAGEVMLALAYHGSSSTRMMTPRWRTLILGEKV